LFIAKVGSKYLTCNESINDELAANGDEVHSPLVAQKRGRLPHKRKMSAVEKATMKKLKINAMSRITLILIKGNEKRKRKKVTYFPSCTG
jgi:hypothetical protein